MPPLCVSRGASDRALTRAAMTCFGIFGPASVSSFRSSFSLLITPDKRTSQPLFFRFSSPCYANLWMRKAKNCSSDLIFLWVWLFGINGVVTHSSRLPQSFGFLKGLTNLFSIYKIFTFISFSLFNNYMHVFIKIIFLTGAITM